MLAYLVIDDKAFLKCDNELGLADTVTHLRNIFKLYRVKTSEKYDSRLHFSLLLSELLKNGYGKMTALHEHFDTPVIIGGVSAQNLPLIRYNTRTNVLSYEDGRLLFTVNMVTKIMVIFNKQTGSIIRKAILNNEDYLNTTKKYIPADLHIPKTTGVKEVANTVPLKTQKAIQQDEKPVIKPSEDTVEIMEDCPVTKEDFDAFKHQGEVA